MIKQTVAVVVAKTIFSVALIVAVLSIALVQQAVNARQQDANSIAAQAARADFSQDRTTPHGSCEDHGYDVTVSPGFCLAFKLSYGIQWAVLELGSR